MIQHPVLIQGGMGVGVSNWKLANKVSRCGQLGVVSGTCIDSVIVRRLQEGDPHGDVRRAMEHFPRQDVAQEVLRKYFVPEGIAEGRPYKMLPMFGPKDDVDRQLIAVLAGFVEVFLAKEGHNGVVGINLLTKIQLPNLPTLYGAMLAGVDYVLMGAGIPREIPGVLEAFAAHRSASLVIDEDGPRPEEPIVCSFDPAATFPGAKGTVTRPHFLPIISTHTLGQMLLKRAPDGISGFVVEGPVAGGHNAPPRDGKINEQGEPEYGPRDHADFAKIAALGLPFWIAGGQGSPADLPTARRLGAHGIQVGTLFAFSAESGVEPALKEKVLQSVVDGSVRIKTDGLASPTGFPFKVAELFGTMSEASVYESRERVCDLGYLRVPARLTDGKDKGKIVMRCSAEPVKEYLKKEGNEAETVGRKCLCNALFSVIGHGQRRRDGVSELPLMTSGDQLMTMAPFLDRYGLSYTALDVIEYLTLEMETDKLARGAGREEGEELSAGI